MLKIKLLNKMPEQVNGKFQNKEVTPSEEIQEITPDENFDGLKKVIVNKIPDEYGKLDDYFDKNIEMTPFNNKRKWSDLVKNLPPLSCSSNITSFSKFFADYVGTTLTFNNFDTSNVTDMSYMFVNSKIVSLNLNNFNTSNVTDMAYMFSGCNLLQELYVDNFDTSNVTTMTQMFGHCPLTNLDISNFDTSNVTVMFDMFSSCSRLASIKFGDQFNTSKVRSFRDMFYWNASLKTLDLSGFDSSNIFNIADMFYRCDNLTEIKGCLQNLGQAYDTTKETNYSSYTLKLSDSIYLTHDSLTNIINGLYDIKTKGCKAQKLTLGTINLAKLTAEEIAIATEKGWTVS